MKDTTYIIRITQPALFKRAMKHQLGLETKDQIKRQLTLILEDYCERLIDRQLGKGD